MSIDKTVRMGQLFSLYKQLLTKKQREMFALYYEEDYSLGEIAHHYDISRQGVHDNIRRGEKALEQYEDWLKLLMKADHRRELHNELSNHLDQEGLEILNKLIEIDE